MVTVQEIIENDFFGVITEFSYNGLANEVTRSIVFWEMITKVDDLISQPMFATILEEME